MTPFKKGRWIWADCEVCEDQYTEYLEKLEATDGEVLLHLSCDTDYTLYINGKYVASNQYGDFEHYKIYDTVDVTSYLTEKSNTVKLLVYYCGVNTQRYRKGKAGLIYEFVSEKGIVAYSSTKTLSRVSPTYISGQKRFVSTQLGFSFAYDATKESERGYSQSICVDKKVTFYPRPTEKLQVLPRKKIREIKKEPWGYLIDLCSEVVGFAALDFVSSCEQAITVAYGESLDNGRVRARIGNRNFLFEYKAKQGSNSFTDHMLRLSCRYLEVICDAPIKINYIGILPQVYRVNEVQCKIDDPLDRKIYDICVNTLRLCMMEHYVDTPWREQCLYAFDSRNQILCGYYAFQNGNADYARANLKLIGEDRRQDRLLSICYPCGNDLTIPSFSLYYLIAIKEYTDHTGDVSLAREMIPKSESILDEFFANSEDGLIKTFSGKQNWNFYDWSKYLDGSLHKDESALPDLVINSLFAMALDSLEEVCKKAGTVFKYAGKADLLRRRIKAEFSSRKMLLSHHRNSEEYTVLGNSLAVLCGAVKGQEAVDLCDQIVLGNAVPSSLSMNIWKYEALLQTDEEKYKDYILNEIRTNYKKMLDAGSTTVWETLEGSAAFGNAGSLCHGWSAVPVYIFHRLGIAKRDEAAFPS